MFGDSCRFLHSVGLSGLTLRQSPPEDSGQDEEKQGIEPLWLPADLTVDICTGADVQDDAWDEDNDFSNWQHEDREAWGTDNTSAWHCGKSARQDGEDSCPEGWESNHDGPEAQQEYDETWDHNITDPADLPLCTQYMIHGSCPHGEGCHLIHGNLCNTCERYALHPYNPEEAEQHLLECVRRHERLAARVRSAQVECGICLDRVLSKTLAADRRFGLLACDHPFCLSCIRSWRATGEADLDSAVRKYTLWRW
ncbi:hypothetical protein CEUSTIGMA_g13622.t1 [Chlamydomonas eustigma]|uniref:C3H1-type domain-containing protein n=1 Tax=Chlamydomonas eustigma TaxID=1157962 RepID=A0A250XT24_9CHLO|nr:hypothetical protein CEUSTIGMA_g13622.t1 [Chlamydomonas eustigma]|eukprot:GAX86208.1 hypothetical protein CEUSTIGMA_g13622.t1 [Chlamydomonas eustigma]